MDKEFDEILAQQALPAPLLAAAIDASPSESALLNSERIEQKFGNYGIEVLQKSDTFRRSSLYSQHHGRRITRTLAVARFSNDDPATGMASEHASIQNGASLGEVFKNCGWQIRKQTLHIGTLGIDTGAVDVARLMRLEAPAELGLHIYRLLLGRNSADVEYATLIELHHPEYLDEAGLRAIYPFDERRQMEAESLRDIERMLLREAA